MPLISICDAEVKWKSMRKVFFVLFRALTEMSIGCQSMSYWVFEFFIMGSMTQRKSSFIISRCACYGNFIFLAFHLLIKHEFMVEIIQVKIVFVLFNSKHSRTFKSNDRELESLRWKSWFGMKSKFAAVTHLRVVKLYALKTLRSPKTFSIFFSQQ